MYRPEAITELVGSLKEEGVLQPIIVRRLAKNRSYGLIAGSRRFRAAKKNGMKKIPAVIIIDVDDCAALVIALTENLQRENLTPFEEGAVILRLMNEFHLTVENVAKRIGRNPNFVHQRLMLLRLPEAVQELVSAKKISLAQLALLQKLSSEKEQIRVARLIGDNRLSVSDTRELVVRKRNNPNDGQRALHKNRYDAFPNKKLILRIQSQISFFDYYV